MSDNLEKPSCSEQISNEEKEDEGDTITLGEILEHQKEMEEVE